MEITEIQGRTEGGVNERHAAAQAAAGEEPKPKIIRHHQVRTFIHRSRLEQRPGLVLLYKDIKTH